MALAVLVAIGVLLQARPAGASAFELNDASWEGCTEFLDLARRELTTERVIVLSTLDWEEIKASDGILVIHPTRPLDAEEAAAFMKAGGRMAVLDDHGRGDKLLSHFKIRRRGLPTNPMAYLRGRPSLPIATPALDTTDGEVLGLHPTVADVKQVVLNHGTGLRHPNLTPVLEVRVQGQGPVTVAVAGQIDGPERKGRLFAMGDPSAFINLMLRYPGNRAFAIGLVHYLADGDTTEPRRGRLFIVANEFGERGSFGGVTPLRKTIDRKLRAMLEAFQELRDNGFPWWLHVAVAALAALMVLWWVSRSLVRLYRSRLPRFARAIPLVAQGGVAGRVAVLSSSSSPAALVLLEIRSAMTEALTAHLDIPEQSPTSALIDQVKGTTELSAGLEGKVRSVLERMRVAETSVVSGAPGRVSQSDVTEAADVVEQLLDAVGVDIPWPPSFDRSRSGKSR